MTTSRYLSNKKITQQSISISPALKEWIERYVRVQHQENPEDERYKSASAFYCSVMEKVLKTFEIGKTLDDFDRLMDTKMKDFFDEFSSNLFIPYVEPAVAMDKYSLVDFKATTHLFMNMLRLFKENVDPYNIRSLRTIFERFRKRYLSSKLTKELLLDLTTEKGKKVFSATWMHWGKYKHLHHLNCKMFAESIGIIGLKITDFDYSEKDLYYKIKFEPTDLFFTDDMARKERIALLKHNVNFVINYWRIVKDKNYYLWIRMAEDNNLMISFKNEKARDKWFKQIEEDLSNFGPSEDFKLNLLYFFERMNWITIENEEDFEFKITLPEEKFNEERQFLLEYLSKHGKISSENGIFYIE